MAASRKAIKRGRPAPCQGVGKLVGWLERKTLRLWS
uniref:Uncharacterized protein n=1 Tax=Arundo donax TaxID=35708 RepID=A0A0A9A7L2_ARUDO